MSNISEKNNLTCVTGPVLRFDGEMQSTYGFFKFYWANLGSFPDRETCFYYCNSYFKSQFGYPRYNSFESFYGIENYNKKN